MKKIASALVSLVAVLLLAFTLTACSTNVVGTYKFKSMTYTENGIQMNIEAGKDIMAGMSVTEDFMVIEIKDDNTFTISAMGETVEGTWTVEGKTLKLEVEGEVQEATLKGKTLTMTTDMTGQESTITFKKK